MKNLVHSYGSVLFLHATAVYRAVNIVRHDDLPAAMRFEVIHQTPDRRNVQWSFFRTLAEAKRFAQEVRCSSALP